MSWIYTVFEILLIPLVALDASKKAATLNTLRFTFGGLIFVFTVISVGLLITCRGDRNVYNGIMLAMLLCMDMVFICIFIIINTTISRLVKAIKMKPTEASLGVVARVEKGMFRHILIYKA